MCGLIEFGFGRSGRRRGVMALLRRNWGIHTLDSSSSLRSLPGLRLRPVRCRAFTEEEYLLQRQSKERAEWAASVRSEPGSQTCMRGCPIPASRIHAAHRVMQVSSLQRPSRQALQCCMHDAAPLLMDDPIAGRPPRWRVPAASTSSGNQSCRRRLCWTVSLWSS